MESNNISFWYWGSSHTKDYREKVKEYIKSKKDSFKVAGANKIFVGVYDFQRNIDENLSGHLFLQVFNEEGNSQDLENFCKYVLSKDRAIKPISVSCKDKKDYAILNEILQNNFGEKSKLTNGFLGIEGLFGLKKIKIK